MIEKILTLSAYEIKQTVRNRMRLLMIAAVPLICGIFFSLTGKATVEVFGASGIFLVLILSSILFSADAESHAWLRRLQPLSKNSPALPISILITGIALMGFQAVLYITMVALLDTESVPGSGTVICAGIIALALRMGTAHLVSKPIVWSTKRKAK